jgi:hypothetical protein
VVRDKGINYPVGVDKVGGSTVKNYALQFWPTYVVIDRAGVIRAAGLIPTKVEEVVKMLLAESAPKKPATASAEFPPEYYYGGEGRPRTLREIEGQPAPALAAAAWLDKKLGETGLKDGVAVVTFVSPSLTRSLAELDSLQPLEKEFASQGARFVAVCDGRSPWTKMQEYAASKPPGFPVMHDKVEERAGEDGKATQVGVTAAAFGVQLFPTSIVIDRSGKVRAAGIRADKIKPVIEKLLAETVK